MKKLLLAAAVTLTLAAAAQTKAGKVVYERTVQMNTIRFGGGGNIPPELQAQLDRMPKSRSNQYELLFTPEHSLYQFLPNVAARFPAAAW